MMLTTIYSTLTKTCDETFCGGTGILSFEDADSEIVCSSVDYISIKSFLRSTNGPWTICWERPCKDRTCTMSCMSFNKLCDCRNEKFSIFSTTNKEVRQHNGVGKAAHARLQVGVHLSTFDRS